MDRPAERRRVDGPGADQRRAGGDGHRGAKKQARHRRRLGLEHHLQREVHRHQRALDVRHLFQFGRHRQGAAQARRRQLVLPHRRLRVRQVARKGRVRRGHGRRRQGARRGPASVEQQRLFLLPDAGAGLEGQGHRPGQRRRRRRQRRQAGRRVRHRQQGRGGGAAVDVHQRRPRHRPQIRAGHVPDRGLLLGLQRRHARLVAALLRDTKEDADDGAGGHVFGRHALSEGGQGRRHRRHGRRHEEDARAARQRRHHPQGHPARRRPDGARHAAAASEEAGRVEIALGLLQGGGRDPRQRGVQAAGAVRLPAGQKTAGPRAIWRVLCKRI